MSNNNASFNLHQIKSIITNYIKANEHNKKINSNYNNLALSIRGDHGIGKTAIAKQIAMDNNFGFYKLSLSQIDELGSLIGYPRKLFKIYKKREIIDKNTNKTKIINDVRWIDQELIDIYINAGFKPLNSKPVTSHAAPEWLNFLNGKKGNILVLDDYTRALEHVLQAVFDLIEEQGYGNWKLPDNTLIILTENPSEEGDYLVNSTDAALRGRFATYDVHFEIEPYIEWGTKNNIHDRLLNFSYTFQHLIKSNSNSVSDSKDLPSAREWTKLFNSISHLNLDNLSDSDAKLISIIGYGYVKEKVNNLITFLINKMDKIPSPKDLLDLNNSSEKVTNLLEKAILKKNEIDYQISALISIRLKTYIIGFAKDNNISIKFIDRLEEILTKNDRLFGTDNVYSILQYIVNSNNKKLEKLLERDSIIKKLI